MCLEVGWNSQCVSLNIALQQWQTVKVDEYDKNKTAFVGLKACFIHIKTSNHTDSI